MKRIFFIFSIIILLPVVLIACYNNASEGESPSETEPVVIKITKDNGETLLSTKTVNYIPNRTVIDYLVKYFDVETAYGGGFVISIDGVKSETNAGDGKGYDWFYYINGESAEIGVDQYIVKENDELVFDFHYWDMDSITKEFIE